ncbi:hypothetical protein GOP47_0030641 [Adiantum capillus-veneris]|nr:hypothetical protein GOP47_0030641 [Adiantum capillus-veneris]
MTHVYAKSLRGDEQIREEEELRRADKRRKRYRASVDEQEVLVTELQKQPLALAWLTANTPLGSTSTVAQVIYHWINRLESKNLKCVRTLQCLTENGRRR